MADETRASPLAQHVITQAEFHVRALLRPVLAGNMLRRLVTRAARAKYGDVVREECEPVQLAAGTKGVGQKLAIGSQLTAELFPDHVFVVLDWKNAFNCFF